MTQKLSSSDKNLRLSTKVFKWLIVAYTVIATLIGTFVIFFAGLAGYSYYGRSAVLPNGFVFTPTFFNRDRIRILDAENNTLVHPSVGGIMWCHDVIYGYRWETVYNHPSLSKQIKSQGKDFRLTYRFIYKNKSKEFFQEQYGLNYVLNGRDYFIELSNDDKSIFNSKIRELNLQELSANKSITYLDILYSSKHKIASAGCTDKTGARKPE